MLTKRGAALSDESEGVRTRSETAVEWSCTISELGEKDTVSVGRAGGGSSVLSGRGAARGGT